MKILLLKLKPDGLIKEYVIDENCNFVRNQYEVTVQQITGPSTCTFTHYPYTSLILWQEVETTDRTRQPRRPSKDWPKSTAIR